MTVPKLKRLKALEDENSRLKRIVAKEAMDIEFLNEINGDKWQALLPRDQR
jgi:hypothetical protein